MQICGPIGNRCVLCKMASSVLSGKIRRRCPVRTSLWLVDAALVAMVLLSVTGTQAAFSCPSGLHYSDTRSDDDFTYLRDPSCRNDFWDPVKYISLNAQGDWYVSFGGEIRERYERFHNPLWGQQPQSPGGYLLQRYLLFGDLHLSESVRIFSELMSDWETARVGGPRPQIDQDQLDFSQFFIDLTLLSRRSQKTVFTSPCMR